jgi:hypothetical protein
MDAYSKHRPNCIAELRDFERRIEELKSQHAAEKAQLLAAHAQELLSRKRNSWLTNMKTIFRYIDDGLCHVVSPALRCIVDFRLFCSFEPLVIAGSLHADYIDGSYLVQGASWNLKILFLARGLSGREERDWPVTTSVAVSDGERLRTSQ